MNLRIGIVGAGYAGNMHADVLRADDRVEVQIGPTASFPELLASSDAIYIATTNTRHAPLALESLAAGKHVFCEKPMATSVADARRVLDAANATNTVFQVGHNRRFTPVYKRLKELLRDSPPHIAHIKMNRGELLQPAWTGDTAVTGGFLYETPIHMFDMMRFQFGEIATIHARGAHEDDFSVLVDFASGMHATFVTSADATWFHPYERFEVFGSYATIETAEIEAIRYRLALDAETITEDFSYLPIATRFGFAEENRLFVDAVLSAGTPPVTALDGFRAVQLVDACYRSAAENEAVKIETIGTLAE
jgi:myo-inositol 2-dehydrogenase/D-chiro-inositol 1-dehydrogenase